MANEKKSEIEAGMKPDSADGGSAHGETEVEKSSECIALLDDWAAQVSARPQIIFHDDGKAYPPESCFAYDGFFPGCFVRKPRVLFIGRETRWISGLDFRDTSRAFFSANNVNGSIFWRRVLYVLCGIPTRESESSRRSKTRGI